VKTANATYCASCNADKPGLCRQAHFQERVADFDASIIPDAQHRVDAARSAYQAVEAVFDAVLPARRSLLDVQLQRLALAVESARAQVRLDFGVLRKLSPEIAMRRMSRSRCSLSRYCNSSPSDS